MRPMAGRSIQQPGRSELPEPRNPPVNALTRDAELLRDMSSRAPRQDPLDKNQTTGLCQSSITVNQEKAFLRVS
jgi:hypothetical protein